MRITSIAAFPIRAARIAPMVATQGMVSTSEFGIVQVDTDEGITGWGEISMSWGRLGSALCRDVESTLGPALLGSDPLDVAGCAQLMNESFRLPFDGGHAAKAALEMALLDITGKAHGIPLFRLLGGRAREAVPVAWPLPWGSVEETVDAAAAAVTQGFRTIKLKIGRPGGLDLQVMGAVRAAVGGDIAIKVDANMAYRSANQALAALRPLEQHRLQLVEQPLPARDLDELARLRDRLETPLLLDESCWELRDVGEIVRRGAADVLNVYVTEMGGPAQAMKAFAAAEAAGLLGLLGSQCELGLGTAAGAHVGVAVSNLGYESDLVGPLRYVRDIVIDPPRITDGMLYPPEGPGLGVEVDQDALDDMRC